MSAGGKRFRPMLALLAAQLGDPRAPGGDPSGRRLRADPPGHAVPRRRHGRGRRPARCAERQQPLDQQHRHPHRRPALRPGVGPAGRPRPRGRAHPGADLRAAGHRADPGDRRRRSPATTRSPTTSTSWPTRPARWSPPPPGSGRASPASTEPLVVALTAFGEEVGRRLPDLRRPARHRQRGRRLREVARHRPARGHRHPAGAVRPRRRRPGRRAAARAGGRPGHRRRRARRGARAAARPRRRWPAPTRCCAQYADRARARLDDVPAGDVRDALSALCDYVVTRTS